jgi:hypothetical protein
MNTIRANIQALVKLIFTGRHKDSISETTFYIKAAQSV